MFVLEGRLPVPMCLLGGGRAFPTTPLKQQSKHPAASADRIPHQYFLGERAPNCALFGVWEQSSGMSYQNGL